MYYFMKIFIVVTVLNNVQCSDNNESNDMKNIFDSKSSTELCILFETNTLSNFMGYKSSL